MLVTSARRASNFRWQGRYSHIYIPLLYTSKVAPLNVCCPPNDGSQCFHCLHTEKEKVPFNILLSYVKFFLKLTSIFFGVCFYNGCLDGCQDYCSINNDKQTKYDKHLPALCVMCFCVFTKGNKLSSYSVDLYHSSYSMEVFMFQ
jgi:hypothetical protein